jgi:uncharacterized membrane protein YdcZ (DUF606 family)
MAGETALEEHQERIPMTAVRIVAILLIMAGIAGLVYGQFSYTRATHEVKLGPLDVSVKEKQTVNIPLWAGIAAILAGGALLVARSRN